MQLIHTNKKIVSQAILIGVLALLPLSFAVAETSIYQEVITTSNSGGQVSNGNATANNVSHVEIMSTTIVNGERHDYYFSSSSPTGIDHQISIETGTPTLHTDSITTVSTSSPLNDQEYETWIKNMITLLNYLQQYVANTF